ncbi:MAG: hypothetical protein ACJ77K_19240 [Bacteroidia bacterium]
MSSYNTFEFLSHEEHLLLVKKGDFIDFKKDEDFTVLLFILEGDYYAEAYIRDGETEIDFVTLVAEERLQTYPRLDKSLSLR